MPLSCQPLLYLPVEGMSATTGAILPKFQPLGVVPLVLTGRICPLPTLGAGKMDNIPGFSLSRHLYSMMRLTVPAPTVLPPSRIAKRKPFSRATG